MFLSITRLAKSFYYTLLYKIESILYIIWVKIPIIYNRNQIIYNQDPIIYNQDQIIYNQKKEKTRLYIIGKKEKQDYI